MSPEKIQHALVLHFHQPMETLAEWLQQDERAVRRLLLDYERLVRHARKYAAVARLHAVFSCSLLEQLRDPAFIASTRHFADVPAILDGLRSAPNIEFIASGYRHAPLSLIPQADREEQLRNERSIMEAVLGRVPKGYTPPGECFTAEMIPLLVKAGYDYVLLPHTLLVQEDGATADPYRAYRLCAGETCITAVPWDRGFSAAQAGGLDVAWFADEVRNGVARSRPSTAPFLLTTFSDAEAGEWFLREDEELGFYGQFFSPCMEFCETGEYPLQPVLLQEYLRGFRPDERATLSPACAKEEVLAALDLEVKLAIDRLQATGDRYRLAVRDNAAGEISREALQEARERILQAEDSRLLLGDTDNRARIPVLLDRAERLLAAPAKPHPSVPPSERILPASAVPAAAVIPAPSTAPATAKTKKKHTRK